MSCSRAFGARANVITLSEIHAGLHTLNTALCFRPEEHGNLDYTPRAKQIRSAAVFARALPPLLWKRRCNRLHGKRKRLHDACQELRRLAGYLPGF